MLHIHIQSKDCILKMEFTQWFPFFLVVVVVVGNSSDKGFCMLILYTALFSILLFM